jgi:hypothetical protein
MRTVLEVPFCLAITAWNSLHMLASERLTPCCIRLRPRSLAPLWTMSLQRLYQLDRSFAKDLDRLLQDKKYQETLLNLPQNELIELVNYLNDVCSPPAK